MVTPASVALPLDAVIAAATRRTMLRHDGHYLYWLEQRPEAQGRACIVRWSAPTGIETLTPETLNVRSRVHEYGGGEFAVRNDVIVFCADPGQRVWLRAADGSMHALTAETEPAGSTRYADFHWHPGGEWLVAVRERHLPDGVCNDLVALSMSGKVSVLADGADFYAAPSFSPEGSQLIWLQWSHPCMPWDETRLMSAEVDPTGGLHHVRAVAGGPDISVLQPGFDQRGRLLAISDQNGFWQLGQVVETGWQAVAAVPGDAAVAPWSLGHRSWCSTADGDLYWMSTEAGWQRLWHLPASGGQMAMPVPMPGRSALAPFIATDQQALFLLRSSDGQTEALIRVDRHSQSAEWIVAPASWPDAVAISPAEPQWLGHEQRRIPFYFYRPSVAPQGAPPLLVLCHSGPTGAATPMLQASVQFWTSRGYAVADTNYRGSDGYGRAWRQSLLGHWGEYDVADCAAVIAHLSVSGQVDPKRIFVRGNSAGGFTVLHLLAHGGPIRAAAVRYPVVDLAALAAESHKFEQEYLGRLVGASSSQPHALKLASPIRQFHRLAVPMLIQQGDQDPVVPLAQARQLADALASRGIHHQLVVFAGEGHGFRRADSLREALSNELAFFESFR